MSCCGGATHRWHANQLQPLVISETGSSVFNLMVSSEYEVRNCGRANIIKWKYSMSDAPETVLSILHCLGETMTVHVACTTWDKQFRLTLVSASLPIDYKFERTEFYTSKSEVTFAFVDRFPVFCFINPYIWIHIASRNNNHGPIVEWIVAYVDNIFKQLRSVQHNPKWVTHRRADIHFASIGPFDSYDAIVGGRQSESIVHRLEYVDVLPSRWKRCQPVSWTN